MTKEQVEQLIAAMMMDVSYLEFMRLVVDFATDQEMYSSLMDSYHNKSVDEALGLMTRLLPGWWAYLHYSDEPKAVMFSTPHTALVGNGVAAKDGSLARAILMATLSAYLITLNDGAK